MFLKIKKFKGSDFNNVDQAFDRSLNKLCEHSNLSVIFKKLIKGEKP